MGGSNGRGVMDYISLIKLGTFQGPNQIVQGEDGFQLPSPSPVDPNDWVKEISKAFSKLEKKTK